MRATPRAWRWTALAVSAVGATFAVGSVVLTVAGPGLEGGAVSLVAAPLVMLLVGAVIIAGRPKNAVGMVLVLGGFAGVVYFFCAAYAELSIMEGPLRGGHLTAWIASWLWLPMVASLPLLMLVFPTGRVPRGFRWVVPAILILVVAGIAVAIPLWQRSTAELHEFASVENPGWSNPNVGLLQNVIGPLLFMGGLVLGAASLVVRWRRAAHVERQQIKWVLLAGAFIPVLVAVGELLPLGFVGDALFFIAVTSLPLAVGIAVLRYRLYDIDFVINRTIVYSVVVVLLAGVYVAGVFVLQELLPVQGDLAVAASTLAVAALFNPVRRRVQGLVDRRFYRSRYDAERVVADFAARLRGRVDRDAITADGLGVVEETMQPATASVWIKEYG